MYQLRDSDARIHSPQTRKREMELSNASRAGPATRRSLFAEELSSCGENFIVVSSFLSFFFGRMVFVYRHACLHRPSRRVLPRRGDEDFCPSVGFSNEAVDARLSGMIFLSFVS